MTLGPVVLDLESTQLSEAEAKMLLHPAVGGVILFARNIHDYAQLQSLVAEIREVRAELLISVDQEGGRVQRCREGFTRLPPMQVFDGLYQQDAEAALQLARDTGWLLASEILAVGIDHSFTPVLDVDDDYCSVIGDRSFSSSPQRVERLAGAFIEGASQAGMAVTGKHFPGHGSVRGDSHLELPTDERPLANINEKDLLPFEQLKDQLDALMPAHILFPQVDADAPVGFSKVWLRDILRQQMGYRGVIFSDDLTMEGAAHVGDYLQRARAALEAGCDMILICNHREGALSVLEGLNASEYHGNFASRESMKARHCTTRTQLESLPRWQVTRQKLQQLWSD